MNLLNVLRIALFAILFFPLEFAFAVPGSLTYQGRIQNTQGHALEVNGVYFEFSITNPSGTCVVYRETSGSLDMRNSSGVFDVPIGPGIKNYPTTAGFKLLDSFSNSGTFLCEGGGTYTPISDDKRLLRVQFHDGTGWKLISPDSEIRSVPYAGHASIAQTAEKLGINVAGDFILKNDLPLCSAGKYLRHISPAGTFECSTPSINGADISGNITGNAAGFTGVLGGDVSGAQSSTSVDKIKGVPVIMTGIANGKVLKYNGTNWAPADDADTQVSGLGTASTKDFGTSAGNLVELDGSGKVPSSVLPASGGDFKSDGSISMTAKFKAADGAWNNPSISFANATGTGFSNNGGNLVFSANSNLVLSLSTTSLASSSTYSPWIRIATGANSSAATPVYSFNGLTSTGMFPPNAHALGFSVDGVETLRFDSAGNTGIGVTTPQTKLQVAGVISASVDNTYNLGSSSYRFTDIYATGSIVSTSDARQKKDIHASDLGLDFINTLKPVSYRWKSGPDNKTHYGLIAQETEVAIKASHKDASRSPAAIVDHDEKTDRYGVRYSELISPLIKAIQELYGKLVDIESQQSREAAEIEKLKAENALMKSYLCNENPKPSFCI